MNRRSFLSSAALGLAALALPSPLRAQTLPPGQWDLLGERRVSFRAERDVIPVGPHDGTYRAMMLDVIGGHPIEIISFVVVFGNGERREFEVREVIQPRSRTRVLDFPGGVRFIRHVELVYRSVGGRRRGRGHVRVFGMR